MTNIDKSLESIGFYTLSDERCRHSSANSDLKRCEIILTNQCNFDCPYCRHVGKHLSYEDAISIIDKFAEHNLKAIRFSGGEPTLYPKLVELVKYAKLKGIERIAISSNGSAKLELYHELVSAGTNDFSISLDACCAEEGDKMAGNIKGAWNIVVSNIKEISKISYVTVGVVLTDENKHSLNGIITFADSLGVSDIRIIPAAQNGTSFEDLHIDEHLLNKYPILRYRYDNFKNGVNVRGLDDDASNKCGLVLDDMAIMGHYHYPCIIYMRERGNPIGTTKDKSIQEIRKDREDWYLSHDCKKDKICNFNCLDVCKHFNAKHEIFKITRQLINSKS